MKEMRVKHIPLNLSGMSAGIRGPIEEKEKRIQRKRLFSSHLHSNADTF